MQRSIAVLFMWLAACAVATVPCAAAEQPASGQRVGRTPRPHGVPPPPLDSEDWVLVVKAHEIGLEGKTEAAGELLPMLEHRRRGVRLAALWSLGRLGRPETLPDIRALAEDPENPLRVAPLARAVAARIEAAAGSPPDTRVELSWTLSIPVGNRGREGKLLTD
ncbi:MAG: HEAT repeat domain-containing protein [Armatimonadetes bacterium]|nr:HEAT repeat domain-containing protein [Armatimonadota bacterium]